MNLSGTVEFLKGLTSLVGEKTLAMFFESEEDGEVILELRDRSRLKLSKLDDKVLASRLKENSDFVDFEIRFKVEKSKKGFELWPVEFRRSDGKSVNCISIVRGKELVNVQRQKEILETSNVWGKNLQALSVVNSVKNVLNH